jgi:aspartyl-tRNA(Asn)/glutamyl-tRNA(Gln) amidotransferase subunit C
MSTPALSADDVRKVAVLARLKLTDAQIEKLVPKLAEVLSYVATLEEVDTENVEPMAHAIALTDVLRQDAVRPGLTREQALSNAPRTDGRYFLVPPILEGG